MKSLIKKFIIGTAQVDNKYSKNFRINKLDYKELNKILNFSLKNNITYIDTALSYKNAHNIIGKLNKKKFKIITKISIPTKKNLPLEIYKQIVKSRKTLKVKMIDGILIHREQDLLNEKGKLIYEVLKDLKKKKIIGKMGFSSYEPKKLMSIIKKYKFDFIQVPHNFFQAVKEMNDSGANVFIHFVGDIRMASSVFFKG